MCSFVKWNIEVNITLQRGSRKLIHPVHYTCSQWALSNVISDMHCLKIKLSGVGIDAILRPTHHNAMLALCLFVCSSLSAIIVILYKYSSLLVEEKGFIYMCVSLSMHFLHEIYVRVKFQVWRYRNCVSDTTPN